MNLRRAALHALGVIFVFSGVACDEKLSSITGPTPNLAPSFTSIQQNIFNATDPSGNLVLLEGRAYQNIVGRPSSGKPGATLIVPGDPDNSYLVKKLEGATDIAGVRMPRGNGPFLSQGQMLVIRRWIEQGAQNN